MNIENKIAADELRSHKKLRDDVLKLEKEAKQAAKFDRLVEYLEYYADICNAYGFSIAERNARVLLAECKELQK